MEAESTKVDIMKVRIMKNKKMKVRIMKNKKMKVKNTIKKNQEAISIVAIKKQENN